MDFLARLFGLPVDVLMGRIFAALSRFMELFFPANAGAAFDVPLP